MLKYDFQGLMELKHFALHRSSRKNIPGYSLYSAKFYSLENF